MEIERKFLIKKQNLPQNLETYPFHRIEQGYLCTAPVVRIRKQDEDYFLTYKSRGLMTREEYNLPLTREAYEHLRNKADGIVLSKTRYLIPEKNGLTIELDVFHGVYEGLLLAEVEFSSEEEANAYLPPDWFGEDVTYSSKYHNSTLSRKTGK
ncbi:MAG: CYTH domain-containing protein [Treponema sp.]|nr:CYTH domain-containing protein [Treponema sp.]